MCVCGGELFLEKFNCIIIIFIHLFIRVTNIRVPATPGHRYWWPRPENPAIPAHSPGPSRTQSAQPLPSQCPRIKAAGPDGPELRSSLRGSTQSWLRGLLGEGPFQKGESLLWVFPLTEQPPPVMLPRKLAVGSGTPECRY